MNEGVDNVSDTNNNNNNNNNGTGTIQSQEEVQAMQSLVQAAKKGQMSSEVLAHTTFLMQQEQATIDRYWKLFLGSLLLWVITKIVMLAVGLWPMIKGINGSGTTKWPAGGL